MELLPPIVSQYAAWLLPGAIASCVLACSSPRISSSRFEGNGNFKVADQSAQRAASAEESPSDQSSDTVDPVVISGTNLVDYNAAQPQCSFASSIIGYHRINCVVVNEQPSGQAFVASDLPRNLEINWYAPELAEGKVGDKISCGMNTSLQYSCEVWQLVHAELNT